jgi:hypothetical protein
MQKGQYHHYIPRFILKNFTADAMSHTKHSKKENLNIYSHVKGESYISNIKNVYGVYNFYKDISNVNDVMAIERSLSMLENKASVIIKRITFTSTFMLTRDDLLILKKFLFIMNYRSKINNEGRIHSILDTDTILETEKFKQVHKLENSNNFWLYNIKTILDLNHDDLLLHDTSKLSTGILQHYMMYNTTFLCVWEAPVDLEFIIGDASFGLAEGCLPIVTYHWLFPISPKIIIVLCDKSLNESFCKRLLGYPPSIFSDLLNVRPTVKYVKQKNSINEQTSFIPKVIPGNPHDFMSLSDEFRYKRIIVSKDTVYKINSILLYHSDDLVSYRSVISLMKTLIYFNRNKAKMMLNDKDFKPLQTKLFDLLNYTHKF